MKIKLQLAILNALSRSLVILLLWLMLPVLVEKVFYKHVNQSLLEKKQKFIEHLDKDEIKDYIVRNDSTETYASFSTLHSEFLQLSRLPINSLANKTIFLTEARIIEQEENDFRILQYQFKYDQIPYQLEIGSSLGEIKELTFIIRFFILIVLTIILILTFLIDTFYIEYLLKPFNNIIDTKIRRINEPDTFNYTPIKSNSADFKELDFALNQMMLRISALFKKERQFIANVSHELLTPIAILKNKFENLLQNDSLNDSAVDKVANSLKTLDMLKKIINNLLLISRIENHQYAVNEEIYLSEILEDLLSELEDRIDEKELEVQFDLNTAFAFIGNKTLIHILLYNLMVNAIKYNKFKGRIVINDSFEDEHYYLSISDSGIGMDESLLSHIFNRFTQINNDQEGQGLGLSIADSIAHFHHIKIQVKSIPELGTTFGLLFPRNSKS